MYYYMLVDVMFARFVLDMSTSDDCVYSSVKGSSSDLEMMDCLFIWYGLLFYYCCYMSHSRSVWGLQLN